MKKSLLTSALFVAMASTSVVFAHHPAADRVDPEIYAMIDENVSDTPHAEMTFDDMGRDSASMDARDDMEARADIEERGQMDAREAADTDERGAGAEAAASEAETAQQEAIDTMDMLDNVASLLAD